MRAVLGVVLILFGLAFVLFKITGVGNVPEWSWWVVLSPFYPFMLSLAYILGAIAFGIRQDTKEKKSSYSHSGTPDGRIKEFFRKRRAARWERQQRNWGKS